MLKVRKLFKFLRNDIIKIRGEANQLLKVWSLIYFLTITVRYNIVDVGLRNIVKNPIAQAPIRQASIAFELTEPLDVMTTVLYETKSYELHIQAKTEGQE